MANNVVGLVSNSFSVYASAARTTSPDTQELTLPQGATQLILTVDVTAVTATPSVVFNIEGVDNESGNTWLLLASAAIATTNAATAVRTLSVGTGLAESANVSTAKPLPRKIRIGPVHGDADSITYSVAGYVA